MRANLEETGMSYALEVEMIALAHAKDMLTTPYIFSAADAAAMAKAGADIVVCHLGLTTGGVIGAQTGRKLEECPALIDDWAEAAIAVNPRTIVLAHGGPVSEPADAEYILQSSRRCHGFYGASSMERLPTERAMVDQTRRFKAITFGQ
jgi:predicted TIM-barrel enzyme